MGNSMAVASRWYLIVRDGTCPSCGFFGATISQAELGPTIASEARAWAAFLGRVDRTELSTRPASNVWSALEYAGHVRDVLALFEERTLLVLSMEHPHFEYQDRDAALIEGRYNVRDPADVADDIIRCADSYELTLEAVPPRDWTRTGTRREDEQFDVGLLARFALHEARHHLGDAEASINS